MKKSAYFSDVLFSFFIVALLTLLIFRHFSLSLPISGVLAFVCGLLAASAVSALLKSKRKNLDLKKSAETQKRKLLTHLALLSPAKQTEFFIPVLSAEKLSPLRLATDDTEYSLFFRFAPVNADEIARLFQQETQKAKCVLCDRMDDDAKGLCSLLNIDVKTGEEVYSLVKERELLPLSYLGEETSPSKHKRRLRIALSKRNGKRFLLSATLLLLTSLFTPFRVYYLLLSAILLLCALFIRIFGYP